MQATQARGTRVKRIKATPPPRYALSHSSWERLRKRLCEQLTCSQPWAEVVLDAIRDNKLDVYVDEKGNLRGGFDKLRRQVVKSGIYPPGGLKGTSMWECPQCKRITPPGNEARLTESRQEQARRLWTARLICKREGIGKGDSAGATKARRDWIQKFLSEWYDLCNDCYHDNLPMEVWSKLPSSPMGTALMMCGMYGWVIKEQRM